MAMLLPQNTNKSKAESSLSISMHLFPPETVRLSRAPGPTIRIFAQGRALAPGLALLALASPVWAGSEVLPAGGSLFVPESLGQTWTGFADWIAANYARAPALVLGLTALMAVPPLALLGLWVSRRSAVPTEISEARTQIRRVPRAAKGEPRDGVRTGHIPLRPLEAWVEVVATGEAAPEPQGRRYGLARTLLRIGRETDNDICLEDITVHRYHAAIHRTEDAEIVITDLSSADGNGVVVNGRAVAEARLTSGDVIELGEVKLRFLSNAEG